MIKQQLLHKTTWHNPVVSIFVFPSLHWLPIICYHSSPQRKILRARQITLPHKAENFRVPTTIYCSILTITINPCLERWPNVFSWMWWFYCLRVELDPTATAGSHCNVAWMRHLPELYRLSRGAVLIKKWSYIDQAIEQSSNTCGFQLCKCPWSFGILLRLL